MFIAFGLIYFVWGIRKAVRNKPHNHSHLHEDGSSHTHLHTHEKEHLHPHENPEKKNITPWVLFTIFVFGPCEPLIPLLMYPAAIDSLLGLVIVTAVFGLVTILTMLSIVMITSWGVSFIPFGKVERYSHAFAGAAIFLSGVAIQFLGL
jgi:ABC-type nickel/cobalt efflux system permease component RcnA